MAEYLKQIVNKRDVQGGCHYCASAVPARHGYARLVVQGKPWIGVCTKCATGDIPTPETATTPLAERPTFPLTSEQAAVVTAFAAGENLAVQAGAGTGKTATLVAIANSTRRQGTYTTFTKRMVLDAAHKMPPNVECVTAHAVAKRQIGWMYQARLDGHRMSAAQMATHMELRPFLFTIGDEPKVIQPKRLASHVMEAIKTFCNTADEHVTVKHFDRIEGVDEAGSWEVNNRISDTLLPAAEAAWDDLVNREGVLRFEHDHYLKIWQLGIHGDPKIPGDFIMFDEGQDATPVMLDAILRQGKQVVFVGDSQQAIYEWRGAIDAMDKVPGDSTHYLTNSFRFGEDIARAANAILSQIDGAKLRLTGRGKAGSIGPIENPDAILTRTNAGAIGSVLQAKKEGKKVYLVGGGGEAESFAKAARDLMTKGATNHKELSIFTSWSEVQSYVDEDPNGADLAVMVKLIDAQGVDAILSAVGNTCTEEEADLVVTTAHKSKGLEWDSVRIHSDFPQGRTDDEALRTMYVAVTRARSALDIEYCGPIYDIVFPSGRSETTEATPARRVLPSEYN